MLTSFSGLQRRIRSSQEPKGGQGHSRVQLQREVHLWQVRLILYQAQELALHVQEDQLVHKTVSGNLI